MDNFRQYGECPQSKFPIHPTVGKAYCVKQVHVRDRVFKSYDACTTRTSRDLTVASLQRLKMQSLIPAVANCKVRSEIKF